jgi:hypothetical protein
LSDWRGSKETSLKGRGSGSSTMRRCVIFWLNRLRALLRNELTLTSAWRWDRGSGAALARNARFQT